MGGPARNCVVVLDSSTALRELVCDAVTSGLGGSHHVTVLESEQDGPRPAHPGAGARRAVDLDSLPAVEAALEATAASGPIDTVVIAAVSDRATRPAALVDGDEDWWDEACERPLRVAGNATRAAHRHLASSDGTLVFVCPSTGLQGAANFVALAACSEGQRILAKSAARQWAVDGIRVNVIAPPLAPLLDPAVRELPESADGLRGRAALVDGFDLPAALADTLVVLASPAGRHLIGVTIPLDGGQVTVL